MYLDFSARMPENKYAYIITYLRHIFSKHLFFQILISVKIGSTLKFIRKDVSKKCTLTLGTYFLSGTRALKCR